MATDPIVIASNAIESGICNGPTNRRKKRVTPKKGSDPNSASMYFPRDSKVIIFIKIWRTPIGPLWRGFKWNRFERNRLRNPSVVTEDVLNSLMTRDGFMQY